jgi:hypothetical protein
MSMPPYIKTLIDQGDRLFSKRGSLMSLMQEVARHFYPERANFTEQIYVGEEFATDLTTSYPLLCRRELGNTFGSMLRPSDIDWFKQTVEGVTDHESKAWLEWATKTQKRAMYDRRAQFVRATKEGDHDYAAFGQCVVTVEVQTKDNWKGLLYRCWHLRDVAWADGMDGAVECVHHKMPLTAYNIRRQFGDRALSESMRRKLEKDPHCEIQLRRIVVPTDMYEGEEKFRTPLVSLYVDCEDGHVVECVGARINPYVIPRWQTVSGSQYAYSPATVCALPDARLIQAMTLTLLEAGEKAVNPPMVGVQEMVRGDVSVYAGGVTWVDMAFDGKLREVLSPIAQDKSGLGFGLDMVRDKRMELRSAFFLDKLDLPMNNGKMTAYEVGQRVQEYIRGALPLFEPVETDYNGGLCERTFEVLLQEGAFGTPDTFPEALRDSDIQYTFTSPLRDAIDKQKGQIFLEGAGIISQALALDPSVGAIPDAKVVLRDTLAGIGWPTKWTRSEEEVQRIADAEAEQAQQDQLLAQMQQGAEVVKNLGGMEAVNGALA